MNIQRDGPRPSAPGPTRVGGGFVAAEAPAGPGARAAIAAQLGGRALDRLILFAGREAGLGDLGAGLARDLGVRVTGCTTAGEIAASGYVDGTVIAIGLPAERFATTSVAVERLGDLDPADLGRQVTLARAALAEARPDLPHGFAFLMCDGLSRREDALMAALAPGLGGLPLFGGSAGDGQRFESAEILHRGRLRGDAAVLTVVRTDLRVKVFSLDNLTPRQTRMVVTAADPERRLAHEINGEPAAREYARLVGLNPDALDEMAFAAHPVAVRLGPRHHVRAIQRVRPDGSLQFFSAVDEGMVLSITEARDLAEHLDEALGALAEPEAPLGILACDCFLRRVAAERDQSIGRVSRVLARHGVRGFSTYGEQVGTMHLNQTLTGVAFYPPGGP